ncbi:proliferating cell nuclear antigen (pcna) [Thermogladius sp. 4427co]|uniref:proliferating cell nuclear antigen (pcna) n=1 Tax=Thermogladius sp. 4427co TaxID=3450718 RepID=UPI003F7967C2
MIKVVYPEARYFKEIVDSLSKLVDEVSLQFTSEKLKITAMDVSSIALIDIEMPPESFAEYNVETPTNIGISLSNLSKILKKAKKGDRLVIEGGGDAVTITLLSPVMKRYYKFRNLDVNPPEIPSANLEFNVEARLIAGSFKDAVKDVEQVSEKIEFEATEEALYVRGRGTGFAETKYAVGSPALLSLSVKEKSKSSYQVSYISSVIGLSKISEAITVTFSSDSPLKLEFSLGTGRIVFLLAPAL